MTSQITFRRVTVSSFMLSHNYLDREGKALDIIIAGAASLMLSCDEQYLQSTLQCGQ